MALRVYLNPVPQTLSMAMWRVAKGLACYVPDDVRIVSRAEDADLQLLHVIGPDALRFKRAPRYVVFQACLNTGAADLEAWQPLWERAAFTWSYYDLSGHVSRFLHGPLGYESRVFHTLDRPIDRPRDIVCMTSGFVTGPRAEAIEEVAWAAKIAGGHAHHLGPSSALGNQPEGWTWSHGIKDAKLRAIYQRSRYVSGLRHVEGFELPVLEGLACGARPIVFDRPEMRRWFDGLAVFVPECHDVELIERLEEIFRLEPRVTAIERQVLAEQFDWSVVAAGFWRKLLEMA